jgi:AcrR family transcriptional regulator
LARRGDIAPVTRETILRVAAEQMAERGYRGTNLSEIATRLGVTR